MTYEELFYEAQDDGIKIVEMNFESDIKGLYANNTIAIHNSLKTDSEKRSVLAEEIGHHYTSCGDILDQSNTNSTKQEKKARNWAYEKLVGITSLVNAYKSGIRNRYELAEYLNVTEDFLDEAIKHFKEKHGMYYQIDNYIVYFDPLGVLEMF
ncbi:ImmA/IrrE family metallo-endopeptidase [Clostridium sp. DJ247]|uniref:ImmA/IrrE family metallo-endopeptidase n=1 Tax=Clostridium sp. DJ247 TaxID=2726188 RepID=UPI0016283C59|nr:ImmA/IrrE family metallo-endopeptidase [Clostridium sp. DJ247]MBC2579698.1 ImmA/IrrE family metallo-endopeptidase [Clostridium sp. DJ247]